MTSRKRLVLGLAFLLVAGLAFALGLLWAGARGAPEASAPRPDAGRRGGVEIRLDPESVQLLPDAALHLRKATEARPQDDGVTGAEAPGSDAARSP